MIKYGQTFGQFELEHPETNDTYYVHVSISYSDATGDRLTPPSFDWDYEIDSVEDADGNTVKDIKWITHDLIKDKLNQIVEKL